MLNLSIRGLSQDHALAVFDLVKDGCAEKKVDTALLRRNNDAPGRIAWVHVHESAHETGSGYVA